MTRPVSPETVAVYIGMALDYDPNNIAAHVPEPVLKEYHVNKYNLTVAEYQIQPEEVINRRHLETALRVGVGPFNQIKVWVREDYVWCGAFTNGPCWVHDPVAAARLRKDMAALGRQTVS